jgi:hypothetical protein
LVEELKKSLKLKEQSREDKRDKGSKEEKSTKDSSESKKKRGRNKNKEEKFTVPSAEEVLGPGQVVDEDRQMIVVATDAPNEASQPPLKSVGGETSAPEHSQTQESGGASQPEMGDVSKFVFDEDKFIQRRDELSARRAELAQMMELQLKISNDMYALLDTKINHLDATSKACNVAGFAATEDGQHRQKKKKGQSEAEAFEAGIEIAMRDRTDPNEPLYCTCHRLSYGDMIGCDNEDCPIEWFHYTCVGIASAPDHWLCPQCAPPVNMET